MDSPFLKWYSPILEVGFPHYSGTKKPSLGELVNLGNCFLLISTRKASHFCKASTDSLNDPPTSLAGRAGVATLNS